MLHLIASNRFEALLEALLSRLDTGGADAAWLGPTVVVPSMAVRRAVTLADARRHGVSMGLRFDFLAQWLWKTMAQCLPDVASESPFAADTLAWRIDALLADRSVIRGHGRLERYVESADEVMRFELARRIAAQFELYTTYRADWLQAWSKGRSIHPPPSSSGLSLDAWHEDAAWQAALWRALAREVPAAADDPIQRFIQLCKSEPRRLRDVAPHGVHLVSLPTLPPRQLQALHALSQALPVHVYALNPSRDYWFDLVDSKTMARWLAQATRSPKAAARVEHAEVGHRLLAGWGRQTQALWGLLNEHLDDSHATFDARHEVPQAAHRLARLQRSMLDLSGDIDQDTPRAPIAAPDDSLEVHVAHSLRRELESLQDRLLARFAQADAPTPGQVLVVTPDIDAAAPLIDAVFGAATGRRHMAYAITGRRRADASGASDALLHLLGGARSRWTMGELDALLQRPLVAQRFGLSADDLAVARQGLLAAGMRWGLDADHRKAIGLPALAHHTLDDAIDRLMLARLIPQHVEAHEKPDRLGIDDTEQATPFLGKAPAPDAVVAGSDALGALAALQSQLTWLRATLETPRTPANWHACLLDIIDAFFAPQDQLERDGLRDLRLSLAAWQRNAAYADGTARGVPWDVVQLTLSQTLDAQAAGAVPGGSITFAPMAALRGLPYRVVAAVGMNDGAFPKGHPPQEFDLMLAAPRPGDRQRRDDDRNAMLDLVLAARDHVWLSYTGYSLHGNDALPPSVLVDELIEAVAEVEHVDAQALREAVVVRHPLQPFAPELFAPDAPAHARSYHEGYAQALQALGEASASAADTTANAISPAADAPFLDDDDSDDDATDDENDDDERAEAADSLRHALAFFAAPLAACPAPLRSIDLPGLQQFFANPARALLTRRLGIHLASADEAPEDDEPFVLDRRAHGALHGELLARARHGANDATLRAWALADARWPAGELGRARVDAFVDAVQRQARALGPHLDTAPLPLGSIETQVDDLVWRLDMMIGNAVHDASSRLGLLRYTHAKLSARDRLEAWIAHLALCALRPDHPSNRTRLVARNGVVEFRPVANATALLEALLRLYAQGMHEPLAFMPASAYSCQTGTSESAVLKSFRGTASFKPGASGVPGEGSDPYVMLAWRGHPACIEHPRFKDVAQQVYAPMLAASTELTL